MSMHTSLIQSFARISGIVFVLIGILGFIPNPIVGEGALFETNTLHDLVHLMSGILALIVSWMSEGAAKIFLTTFGVIYLLVALMGFFMESPILGILPINSADNWLHVLIALSFIGIGLTPTRR